MRKELTSTSLALKLGVSIMKKVGVRGTLFLFLAAAGLLLTTPSSDAALIDNFNNGGGSVTATAGGNDTDSSAAAGIIGGTRVLAIPGANPVAGPLSLAMDANPGGTGQLFFSLDGGTTGSAIVSWDNNGAGLGGADLTDAGLSTFISFDIVSIDQGNVDLFVTVVDQANVVGTRLLSGAGAGTKQFTFASFSGAPNFADVKSISLEIRGLVAASDVVVDQIFSSGEIPEVPEPSAYVLGIMGLVAMTGVILRRRCRPA